MNAAKPELFSELMIMPDGRVFAHNLTPAMAQLLGELNPHDPSLRKRMKLQRPETRDEGLETRD